MYRRTNRSEIPNRSESEEVRNFRKWKIGSSLNIHVYTVSHVNIDAEKRTIFETIKYKIFLKSVILERSYIKLVLHKIQLRKIND